MRRPAILAALAVALLAVGCGSSNAHSARPAVAAYVNRVNTLEKQLASPLKAVTVAGSKLPASTTTVNDVEIASLRSADNRMVTLRDRLAAIPAPSAAGRLRILVLLLAGGEIDMTNELSELFSFLPQYGAALKQLAPVTTQLRAALAGKGGATSSSPAARRILNAKARALTRYETELDSLSGMLGRLSPPPVARPQYETEVHALSGMETSAGALAHALLSASSDIPARLATFDRAAVATDTLPAQRAEIAAVRAYDARIAKLNELAGQVASQRLSLQQSLR
jgi:hypothetical protein